MATPSRGSQFYGDGYAVALGQDRAFELRMRHELRVECAERGDAFAFVRRHIGRGDVDRATECCPR